MSRADRLKQLERQIRLADVQRASYDRTMQRAEADGDAARVAEYGQRLAGAVTAAGALRLEWLATKWELCEWMAGRKRV